MIRTTLTWINASVSITSPGPQLLPGMLWVPSVSSQLCWLSSWLLHFLFPSSLLGHGKREGVVNLTSASSSVILAESAERRGERVRMEMTWKRICFLRPPRPVGRSRSSEEELPVLAASRLARRADRSLEPRAATPAALVHCDRYRLRPEVLLDRRARAVHARSPDHGRRMINQLLRKERKEEGYSILQSQAHQMMATNDNNWCNPWTAFTLFSLVLHTCCSLGFRLDAVPQC